MPWFRSATVPLSEFALVFLSGTTIWAGLAKTSFWREIIFSKRTNISLEQLNPFWNILLVGFIFWKLETFFNPQNRFFSLFIQKYTFPRNWYYIITIYYPSLSVKYQWRYELLSYIKISIYTFPLQANSIFTSPSAHSPAVIPADLHSLARC